MTINDIDIYRSAKLLIDKHGDEADIVATKRAAGEANQILLECSTLVG